jgi:hypothetical protein
MPYRVGHDLVDGDGEVVDLRVRHPALAGRTAHLVACFGQGAGVELGCEDEPVPGR